MKFREMKFFKKKAPFLILLVFIITTFVAFSLGRSYQSVQDGFRATRNLSIECLQQFSR